MSDKNLKEKNVKARPRPLSPHLQVYKPQLTSMLSILHRGTGVFLYLNVFVLAFYLYTIAFWVEGDLFYCATGHGESTIGIWVFNFYILALLFSLYFHFCTGLRHLFWDIGYLYEISKVYLTAKAIILVTIALTSFTWVYLVF